MKLKILFFTFLFSSVFSFAQVYDLVIKGGMVVDPRNGINSTLDIAISEGKIAAVEKSISEKKAKKIIDAKGLLVTPGLIDIHGHHFYGTSEDSYLSDGYSALAPDGFTLRSGVTTVVDCGGAGWRNFNQFKAQTIDHSKTRVLSFLNIVGHGMKGGVIEQNIEDMNPRMAALVAQQFKQHIVGFKLAHFSGFDWTPTERVVEAGQLANLPVIIDFGGSNPELPLDQLFLEKLRPGDIFTHAYAHVNGRTPITDANGKVHDYVFEAQKRGIIFDVGHGGGSFLFEQAAPATAQGFYPNSISTDLHTGSMNGGMKDMINVMSKFINLGMPLVDVIAASTSNPAEIIHRSDLGHLSIGAEADIAILQLEQGQFGFVDTQGKRMNGSKRLVCELTVRAGSVVYDLNGLSAEPWNKAD